MAGTSKGLHFKIVGTKATDIRVANINVIFTLARKQQRQRQRQRQRPWDIRSRLFCHGRFICQPLQTNIGRCNQVFQVVCPRWVSLCLVVGLSTRSTFDKPTFDSYTNILVSQSGAIPKTTALSPQVVRILYFSQLHPPSSFTNKTTSYLQYGVTEGSA